MTESVIHANESQYPWELESPSSLPAHPPGTRPFAPLRTWYYRIAG
jgi:hypothetical protein